MASVKVTLNGVIFPKTRAGSDQPVPCTFVGEAWYSDLGVGGYSPPWARPPVDPGYSPPWATPTPPHPAHPIVNPPTDPPIPPEELPDPIPPSSVIKEPPDEGGWGLYSDANSAIYWAYTPAITGVPKRP